MRTRLQALALAVTLAAVVTPLAASRFVLPAQAARAAPPVGAGADESYPYRSPAFSRFVADSYAETPSQGVQPFYAWLETAYAATPMAKLPGHDSLTLEQALALRRADLHSARDPGQRALLERDTAAWLHRLVKATIPRFSFDRGFEFVYAVTYGERQCLLQSVLIAALLQAMDVRAGVVMVWKSEKGTESNNGHAVAVARLSDGRDVLVDASDPQPFMRHQGLFAVDRPARQYRFVLPLYDADATIAGYRPAGGGGTLRTQGVGMLDTAFLRSQFYYYRGERAPGGFLGRPATRQGLGASARYLERAQGLCPQNPLAVYVLGHVYLKQGKTVAARVQYLKGYRLYQRFGWIPAGPREAYAASASQ